MIDHKKCGCVWMWDDSAETVKLRAHVYACNQHPKTGDEKEPKE